MKIKVEFELSEELQDFIVRRIMENYPESGAGMCLRCEKWDYEKMEFGFLDTETGLTYMIGKKELVAALPKLFTDLWPKGCTQPPASGNQDDWNNWLGQADGIDDDAFVQLVCLGKVIYG